MVGKAVPVREDPCFTCQLSECDDTSPRCAMRRLNNLYLSKLRRGEKDLITAKERAANNFIWKIFNLERCAEAAEGGRPYKRWEQRSGARHAREQRGTA